MISKNIFNEKANYALGTLFLGESPGLFDTINKRYPKVWSLYKKMKDLDWDENEFIYTSCNLDFKTCNKDTYEMMIRALAWQWEADSVAARSISAITAPFVSSSELLAAWSAVATNEVLHAATYSEIVRSSFDNPEEVIQSILSIKSSLPRLETVGALMDDAYIASHKYALGLIDNDQELYNIVYMFVVAMYCLERIQFIGSFAITFAICRTGIFGPIRSAVEKIAQDELEIHAALDRVILDYEHATERGKLAFTQCRGRIQNLIDEVVDAEYAYLADTFSEERQAAGITEPLCQQWVSYCAAEVYACFGLTPKHKVPDANPLKFMEKHLNLSKIQISPMEENGNQYALNPMIRTDKDMVFDTDF